MVPKIKSVTVLTYCIAGKHLPGENFAFLLPALMGEFFYLFVLY